MLPRIATNNNRSSSRTCRTSPDLAPMIPVHARSLNESPFKTRRHTYLRIAKKASKGGCKFVKWALKLLHVSGLQTSGAGCGERSRMPCARTLREASDVLVSRYPPRGHRALMTTSCWTAGSRRSRASSWGRPDQMLHAKLVKVDLGRKLCGCIGFCCMLVLRRRRSLFAIQRSMSDERRRLPSLATGRPGHPGTSTADWGGLELESEKCDTTHENFP